MAILQGSELQNWIPNKNSSLYTDQEIKTTPLFRLLLKAHDQPDFESRMIQVTREIISKMENVGLRTSLPNQIIEGLCSQSFRDWYPNQFQEFITGGDKAPPKQDIIKRLKRIFNIQAFTKSK